MKERGDRLKCVVYESTRAPLTRSPFPNGEGCETRMPLFSIQRLSPGGRQRGGGFAAEKESQPRLAALGSPFQGKGLVWTLPPSSGRRCPEGAEVGWGKRYEREGEIISGRRFTKAPSARKQLIKPIYSYKKRKSNAANDFNVICRSGYRYMQEKSEAVHFYD